METIQENIVLIIPVLIIQIALMIFALIDLSKREKSEIRGENKLLWVLVIIFLSIIGPIVYFILGKNNERL